MQLRYLRHRYDVVYDRWIAAVRKSAVWIFAAIEYSITPVVLEGMRPSKDIGGDIVGHYTRNIDLLATAGHWTGNIDLLATDGHWTV